MVTRSVRLDEETESALAEVMGRTGQSISEANKQGLIDYRESSRWQVKLSPAGFFESFDLGEGGYSTATARQSKEVIRAKLKKNRPAL